MSIYLLALLPSEKLQHEIRFIKEEVNKRFGAKNALKLPAHITLHKPFKLRKEKEGDFIKTLTTFCEEQQPFEIELCNFGKFDQRVIYITVGNKVPVIELAELLQNRIFRFLEHPEKNEQLHPHLTIATRDLDKNIFPEAWTIFRDQKYYAIFEACNISLFRLDGLRWDLIQEFPFRSFKD